MLLLFVTLCFVVAVQPCVEWIPIKKKTNAVKALLILFDQCYNTGTIDVKMDLSVLEWKSSFKMLGLNFSSKWIGALRWSLLLKLPFPNCIRARTLSILLTLYPRKLKSWFVLWIFFLLKLLCISVNLPYSNVWNTVVISGLLLLVAK